MSIIDGIFSTRKTPHISSILPSQAISEILGGRLPILGTTRIFLNDGELCHYMDRAIYQKQQNIRIATRGNRGYRAPGLFPGTSLYSWGGRTISQTQKEYIQIRGMFFITNQRVIFSSETDGFVYPLKKIVGIKAYSNAVDLQFEKLTLTVFVPDGNVVNNVLHMVR